MKSKRRYLTITALAALGLGGLPGGVAANGPSGSRPLATPKSASTASSTTTVRADVASALPTASVEPVGASAPTSAAVRAPGTDVESLADAARGEVRAAARSAAAPEGPSRAPGRIAFVLDNAIHTVNPNGTELSRLAPEGAFDQDPASSPSHDRIAFGRGANIHVTKTDGSEVTQLTSAGLAKAPTWSPDGGGSPSLARAGAPRGSGS